MWVSRDAVLNANRNPDISKWMGNKVDELISFGIYHPRTDLLVDIAVKQLAEYKKKHNLEHVVIGISGGVDSAVTAALFQQAGYTVHGYTLSIYQNPAEIDRGIEICDHLGLECKHLDLSSLYKRNLDWLERNIDHGIADEDAKKRRGNIRARLRMMTLYNQASFYNGIVASTDNFSELAAGFWTLHGDVGDVAPIQSFSKSWEVPEAARVLNLPASVIQAVPTDGLGIDAAGDESQLGVSYLEFDTVLFTLMRSAEQDHAFAGMSNKDKITVNTVQQRIRNSRFKRNNPFNLEHGFYGDRFQKLVELDKRLDK
jgi:NAD+ synthetase